MSRPLRDNIAYNYIFSSEIPGKYEIISLSFSNLPSDGIPLYCRYIFFNMIGRINLSCPGRHRPPTVKKRCKRRLAENLRIFFYRVEADR